MVSRMRQRQERENEKVNTVWLQPYPGTFRLDFACIIIIYPGTCRSTWHMTYMTFDMMTYVCMTCTKVWWWWWHFCCVMYHVMCVCIYYIIMHRSSACYIDWFTQTLSLHHNTSWQRRTKRLHRGQRDIAASTRNLPKLCAVLGEDS